VTSARVIHRQPAGIWWRFDRYEIRGDFIRPAPGAALGPFDPSKWPRSGKADCPPHLELARLVRAVPRGPWPKELRDGVLDWCRRHGLLGLMPHNLLSVRLGSWQLDRSGQSWVTSYSHWEADQYGPPWGEVIESDFGDGVIYNDANSGWANYFPDLWPKDRGLGERALPELQLVPTSEEFWRAYGEPFDHFVRIACHLGNALTVIADPDGEPVIESGGVQLEYDAALARLNALAAPVSTEVVRAGRGKYHQTWQSPSLLGYLAMQAVQDLLGERRILKCPCDQLFATTHHRARHCSKTCADRWRQRAHRARRNAKRSPIRKRQRVKTRRR